LSPKVIIVFGQGGASCNSYECSVKSIIWWS